jgi:hypothetical protein
LTSNNRNTESDADAGYTPRAITPKGLRFIELLFRGFDEEEASLIAWSEFKDDGATPRPQN